MNMYTIKKNYSINILILLLFSIFLIGCGSKNYKIEKEANQIPLWYMEEKKNSKKIYAKASASSPSLELAGLKALNLALSDIAIRAQGSVNSSRVQELNESLENKKLAKNYIHNDSIKNNINVQVIDFKIPEYIVVKKEAFLDHNKNYKVYILLEFNKENI